jgi:HD superfamily phosphohydrolase
MLEPRIDHRLSSIPHLSGNLGIDPNSIRYRPQYELGDDFLFIRDSIWDEEHIGEQPHDQLLVDLAHTDALRRLQTIEQLTLPERYSTIPDTAYFSRWEHVWGSLIFVRRMAGVMELDPKESMYLQLKVLLSDLKHTAFSHAGDWMFEGEGGPENNHEKRTDYAEIVGLNKLLQRYGFDSRRVFDDEAQDITDMPKPFLDGDRVDYTLREGNRWVDQAEEYKEHLNADSFTVKDGRIIAKSQVSARMMAVTHAMLVSENWQHPIHRINLNLLIESLKRVFVAGNGKTNDWGSYSPRDLMTTADHTLLAKFRENDEFSHLLDSIMASVARSEKQLHWRHRRETARFVIEKAAGKNPVLVEWIRSYYDILPSSCEITQEGSGQKLHPGKRMVVVPLPALRRRYIDPHFLDSDNEVQQLSKADPEFWRFVHNLLEPSQTDWQAGLVQNEVTTANIRQCLLLNQSQWEAVLARPRLPSGAVRQLLRKTVQTSLPDAAKFIDFTHKT